MNLAHIWTLFLLLKIVGLISISWLLLIVWPILFPFIIVIFWLLIAGFWLLAAGFITILALIGEKFQ